MLSFNGGEPVAQVKCQTTQPEYAEAFALYHRQQGLLYRNKAKAAVFVVLAVLAGFILKGYYNRFGTVWVPCAIIVFCVGAANYYLLYVPEKVRKLGAEEYQSNLLLALPYTVTVYRDGYSEENPYETFLGYWADRTGCAENASFFVVMGGWDRSLLIIPKKDLTPQQQEGLTSHFANTFVKKYKKL